MNSSLPEQVVRTMLERDRFSAWLGISLQAIAPGQVTVAMTVREEMVNGFGVGHGGIAYSLADTALAFAANTVGRVTVSIENSISYPAPVRVGDRLTAAAVEESSGRRIAFYRVAVTNQDGSPVAHFRGTVYRTNEEYLGQGTAAP